MVYAAKKITKIITYNDERDGFRVKEHFHDIYSITEVSEEYGVLMGDYNPTEDSKEELVWLLRKIADDIEVNDVVDAGAIRDNCFWEPAQ